jgi:hypothetical protein
MKACEPKSTEQSKWNRATRVLDCKRKQYSKTNSGILVETKTYVDYLKESSYRESYKKFCIDYYLSHKQSDVLIDNKKSPEGDSL